MEINMDLVSFSGRVNRAPWWLIQLAILVFMTAVSVIGFVSAELRGPVAFVKVIFSIPMLWVSLAVGTRRLHDRDKSGGWLVIFYVLPWILRGLADHAIADHAGALYFFFFVPSWALYIWGIAELGFPRGTVGPNQYGPDPLEPAAGIQPA
jgi:uncharacterized membrane protein YhaH (DUF805 family)